jgi:hypothetical protein
MVADMNNPAAFPRPFSGTTQYAQDGMTLRDYFAAKAMQAAITGCATRGDVGVYSNWANLAYEVADAMLKARDD